MAKIDLCTAQVQKATGLSDFESREIAELVSEERARIDASGRGADVEKLLAEFGTKMAQDSSVYAAMQRRHAVLNILKRDALDQRLSAFVEATKDPKTGAGNYKEAFYAILTGSRERVANSQNSVAARRVGIVNEWLGGIEHELDQIPGAERCLQKDKAFIDDVVREMHEVKEGGNPGVTGSPMAQKVADIFSRYAEMARVRMNEAGANIGKLAGWVPQSHDASKLAGAGQAEWAKTVAPLLDFERTFPDVDPKEVPGILADIYQNIIGGIPNKPTPQETGQFVGPRNLAKGMGKERVLHFKDADAWIQYQNMFGDKNLLSNLMHHFDIVARKLSLMETFGPNPETMLGSLVESAKRRVKEDPTISDKEKMKIINGLSGSLEKRSGGIARRFSEVMGETLTPENPTVASIGSNIRAVNSMAKLGGAVLSSLVDVVTYSMESRHLGKNALEGYADAFGSIVGGYKGEEKLAIVRSLGVISDTMMGDAARRWSSQDAPTGVASQAMNRFFKWSGLTAWTNNLKAGAGLALAHELGDGAGKSFDGLFSGIRDMLTRHGITPEKWEVLRQGAFKAEDGRAYLTPDRMRTANVDGLISDRLASMREKIKDDGEFARQADRLRSETRKNLETEFRSFFINENRYAVIEPDDRTRAMMIQGTRPGSFLGEAVRFVTQFKSFPIAYTQRILSEQRWQVPGRGADLSGLANLIAGSMVMGYAAMTAKDFVKGKEPRDPSKPETWMAAVVQSGGAGIYGDFLFAKVNRFGGGIIDTLAGPTAGTINSVFKLYAGVREGEARGGDALRLAMDNTPFINLWYTRAALDYAILYHLQEMVSPGTLARREYEAKKDFNQQYLFPPSKNIRTGGGYRSGFPLNR